MHHKVHITSEVLLRAGISLSNSQDGSQSSQRASLQCSAQGTRNVKQGLANVIAANSATHNKMHAVANTELQQACQRISLQSHVAWTCNTSVHWQLSLHYGPHMLFCLQRCD